jgi:serine/threonine protein kinase
VLRCAREFRFGRDRWAQILADLDLDAAECLSDKPWGTVWRVTAALPTGETELVMKVHALRSPRDRVRSSLHLSRLRRQWRGAARLSRAGFRVAKCRALLRAERDGQRFDVLVMDATPGRTLLDVMASGELTPADARTLAVEVGRLVARLSNERLHSKDLKPSNLLVGPPAVPGHPPSITILDSDAVGQPPAHPLLPLLLEPTGLGLLPRRTVLWRAVKTWAWHEWLNNADETGGEIRVPLEDSPRPIRVEIARRAWRDLGALIRAHGDARPVHNPIADTPALARSVVSG